MTTFSSTYDTATPGGSDDPAEADDRMREIKAAVQERENVDHYWPLTGTEVSDTDAGEHRKVTLRQTSKPTAVASKAFLYSKDIGGQAEFFVMSEDGVEIQVSRDGKLNLDLNILANNTAIKADNEAGDGTVDLIKVARNVADDADVVQLPDSTRMATSAAPAEDTELANKKYVDDNIGSANYIPTSYAGEESITFPNGLIMKQGIETSVGADSTSSTTFGVAFPTAIVSYSVSIKSSAANLNEPAAITAISTSAITVKNNDDDDTVDLSWQVWGY